MAKFTLSRDQIGSFCRKSWHLLRIPEPSYQRDRALTLPQPQPEEIRIYDPNFCGSGWALTVACLEPIIINLKNFAVSGKFRQSNRSKSTNGLISWPNRLLIDFLIWIWSRILTKSIEMASNLIQSSKSLSF